VALCSAPIALQRSPWLYAHIPPTSPPDLAGPPACPQVSASMAAAATEFSEPEESEVSQHLERVGLGEG
jgi:hypothetical protein